MRKYKIPISKPSLSKEDLNELIRCFNSSWISSRSPWVERFEKVFAKKVSGTKYAVTVNSGTSAIFLALKAVGIKAGDEVIMPTLTMIATANAVSWIGAKPVLVDSQSFADWNLNPEEIEKKVTEKTKAIIPVHLYGYPCQMGKILKIAKKYKVYLIEDAAEATGSLYKGYPAGSFGDLSCFSLYANKVITAGNGGVVATDNKKLSGLIKQLRFFDYNEKTHFTHYKIGYNLVLSGLQAALGLSQLRRLEKLLLKRRQIFEWYKEFLDGKRCWFIYPKEYQKPNFWFPAIVFANKNLREKVRGALGKKGIETRIFFRPIHLQPVYRKLLANQKFPQAEYFFERGLLLPSFYDLAREEVKMTCQIIQKEIR